MIAVLGGFGVVRFASKITPPNKFNHYAIKSLLKSNIISRKHGISCVFQELNILAMADNPFICNCHYAFQDKNYLYLVLDLASCGDLRYNLSISPNKRFSEILSKFYIVQLIFALQYIHSIGVLHRDVKPEVGGCCRQIYN